MMAEKRDDSKKKYESYAFDHIKPVVLSTVAILAVAMFSFISMWGMFLGLERASLYLAKTPPPMSALQQSHVGMLLQTDPPAEFSAVHAEAQKMLSEYGWVDKDAGVVHIPIARAMDMSLVRGFPVRPSSR